MLLLILYGEQQHSRAAWLPEDSCTGTCKAICSMADPSSPRRFAVWRTRQAISPRLATSSLLMPKLSTALKPGAEKLNNLLWGASSSRCSI